MHHSKTQVRLSSQQATAKTIHRPLTRHKSVKLPAKTSEEIGFFGDLKTELFSQRTRKVATEALAEVFNASMYEV